MEVKIMAMNLTSNKAKIVWITFVDGKEKKSTKSYDLYKDPETDETAVKNALQSLVSLGQNTNAAYFFDPEYQIV
jgi:hypothetical protein